jgi:chromosome segregation ATPase
MIAATLTLSVLEVVLLLLGAIILGITIHFFIASNKSLKATTRELQKETQAQDEWKLRYFNDIEQRDKELASFKQKLMEAEENVTIYSTEAEEMNRQNRKLEADIANLQKTVATVSVEKIKTEGDFLDQLRHTQNSLLEHHQKINLLLSNIDVIKEKEEMQREVSKANEELSAQINGLRQQLIDKDNEIGSIRQREEKQREVIRANEELSSQINALRQQLFERDTEISNLRQREEKQREVIKANEELSGQVNSMRQQLSEKDTEITNIRQKEQLTSEMKSMLDNTYNEFNTLQGKIQKLESQLTTSKMMNLEYEDLKETHHKMSRDFEEVKIKLNALTIENQHLQAQATGLEDKLREANFQKQQLQKRSAYLEELNSDLQVVADANKKLEAQLRRVGELESMLNVVSEERDHLVRKGQ